MASGAARTVASGTTMGIKFLCPNGHKLHVKAFLSGKKAFCPKCGARVVVPDESTSTDAAAEHPPRVGEQSIEIPLQSSLVDDAIETMTAEPAAGTQATQPAAEVLAAPSDAIDEAPQAVWYVRPATGGQFGPASAEMMRSWLNDGRVAASSLVWREPWTEWRSAADTFPQLRSALVAPSAGMPANAMPPLPAEPVLANGSVATAPPQTISPLAQAARTRRRKNDVTLIASAVLVVVSLILVIVLVLVLGPQRRDSEKPIEESPASDELTLI